MSESFELIEGDPGQLILKRPGVEDVRDVRIRRAFPWTQPDQFISLRSKEGKELVMIDDLSTVEPALRKTVERWLEQNSFIPRILRIESVDVSFGYQLWKVQTNRGPAEFRVQEREDVRFLQDGRFSVRDADGNVYELPPLDQLDPASREAAEALL